MQQEALGIAAANARQTLAGVVRDLSQGMAQSAGNTQATRQLLTIVGRCNSNIAALDEAIKPMIPSQNTTPTAAPK